MGLLDTILGRSKPAKPDLDALFALPSAAITLQAGAGLTATGVGSVCVKPAEGGGFAGLRERIDELLAADNDRYTEEKDSFGFSWITRHGDPRRPARPRRRPARGQRVPRRRRLRPGAALHAGRLRRDGGTPVGLVYLYKRGTWYPFVPTGKDTRDNARELQVRAVLGSDLKVEDDLSRWFPVWGAPGL